jgi:hypothetical protein
MVTQGLGILAGYQRILNRASQSDLDRGGDSI